MLFNSVEFAFFLPIVFLLYWFVVPKNAAARNIYIIIISYIFYGWWDWRFLSLIMLSSIVDYRLGIALGEETRTRNRKFLLTTSIVVNIGILAIFKYNNFFVENFAAVFTLLGQELNIRTLRIVLPVGISFYTFQTLSYSIDVYRRKIEHTRDVYAFFAFVSFFPQLVAGPIERATSLLPQFYKAQTFNYSRAVDGMRQILWGLFKKVVIADRCAPFVDQIFANDYMYGGSTLLFGAVLFALQIYGDFSGYSDIAIGTARLFGFKLRQNFAYPYFSRDIAEFWRRWHISLSTWFRDYLYIPLGGSSGGTWRKIRNTFIIFTVSGFWHGAGWNFVAWGALHAVYITPLMLMNRNRKNLEIINPNGLLPGLTEVRQILTTFLLHSLALVVFRARDLTNAYSMLKRIFSASLFFPPIYINRSIIVLVFIMLAVEWVQRDRPFGLDIGYLNLPRVVNWAIYYAVVITILYFGSSQETFFYFQF